MSFERARAERSGLPETEENLYRILVPEFEKSAISMDRFRDLYGETAVEKDKEYIASLEGKFEESAAADPDASRGWQKRGKLFEAIVWDQTNESDWLGPDAEMIAASRHDDVVNKVDGIIEFKKDRATSHLALAIDITESTKELRRKFDQIKASIDEEKLSRVKYFASENMRGELKNVPRVVVGADTKTMLEVSELILNFKTKQRGLIEGTVKRGTPQHAELMKSRVGLAEHPLQFQILQEILIQLDSFKNYAAEHGKDAIAKTYGDMQEQIKAIIAEKRREGYYDKSAVERDEVYNAIVDLAAHFE